MAHVDAGKTTATERMLYYTGFIHKMGNVDHGNTIMDTDPQESKRGITISSAAITTSWFYKTPNGDTNPYQINLIDTPGHIDFVIEVERSLRVLDGAVALFCAQSGVEPQSENVWHLGTRYGVPRICFVNKMDRRGADFLRVVDQIQHQLNVVALPVQLPIGIEDDFCGVIDLIGMKALIWDRKEGETWHETVIPESYEEISQKQRHFLLESLAEQDEIFLSQYLDESYTVDEQDIIDALRRATTTNAVSPVLCGSSYRKIAVQPLLDAVVRYLPAPNELPELIGLENGTNHPISISRNEEGKFTALVFKVIIDKHVGRLAMVRVYARQLQPGQQVINARTGETLRVSRIFEMHSDKRIHLEKTAAGQICALTGLKEVRSGDTLCALGEAFALESFHIPDPVISVSVEPATQKDLNAMGQALAWLAEEDPSLRVESDGNTGQVLLKGMGELHLEVSIEKLRLNHDLHLNQGAPRVAYREEITQLVEHRERFAKQNGGSGQFADITFRMETRPDNKSGLELIDQTKGGVIPREYFPSIEKGFKQAMLNGVLGGYPLESLKVTVLDGEIHREDSHALDFEIAAKKGFQKAAAMAAPRLLEPIMSVEIETSETFTGVVSSDLNRRRGLILMMDEKNDRKLIRAELPLANTFGYISDLRNMTSGRASFSMKLSHYSAVPEFLLEDILNG